MDITHIVFTYINNITTVSVAAAASIKQEDWEYVYYVVGHQCCPWLIRRLGSGESWLNNDSSLKIDSHKYARSNHIEEIIWKAAFWEVEGTVCTKDQNREKDALLNLSEVEWTELNVVKFQVQYFKVR